MRSLPFPSAPVHLTCTASTTIQAGKYKLGDWLDDPDTVVMLKSGVVRSLTFKQTETSPNITKEKAVNNSQGWYFVEDDTPSVDLPSADWDEPQPPPTPSSASEAGSSASTLPFAGRVAGRVAGRGRAPWPCQLGRHSPRRPAEADMGEALARAGRVHDPAHSA